MSSELTAQAPAKLNLFLHVTGRRADGFHTLQTAFQFIDLCDTVTVSQRPDGDIVRTRGSTGIDPEADLAVRAARLLRERAGSAAGASVAVDKRIPAGGGLGGGSSDAAATLVLLNRLWGLDWKPERLAALGLELGADVPVFVHGEAAWAEGIGERLTPLTLPETWYLVVDPGVPVATAELYQAPDLTRDTPPMTIPDLAAGAGHNDFEPLVRARYPEVAAALDWLAGFGGARLTGTGSCVFSAFPTGQAAREACEQVPARWQGHVARGLDRSPLWGVAKR